MTEQQLTKGQDIQHEISHLKSALSELLRCRIFSVETGGMRITADPFLADLEVKTRSFAATAINDRIATLQDEFKSL